MNIHYRAPIQQLLKRDINEEELNRKQREQVSLPLIFKFVLYAYAAISLLR